MKRSEQAAVNAERLRYALNVELSELCDRESIDMSRAMITSRIRELAELSTLCLALAQLPPEP